MRIRTKVAGEQDNGKVTFEVLRIDDCPSWELAVDRFREALRLVGNVDMGVEVVVVKTSGDISGTAFNGSPTLTMDGVDLFPLEDQIDELACRVYFTPAGMAGAPTVEQIVERITAHV